MRFAERSATRQQSAVATKGAPAPPDLWSQPSVLRYESSARQRPLSPAAKRPAVSIPQWLEIPHFAFPISHFALAAQQPKKTTPEFFLPSHKIFSGHRNEIVTIFPLSIPPSWPKSPPPTQLARQVLTLSGNHNPHPKKSTTP
jgi:hypothetical protein